MPVRRWPVKTMVMTAFYTFAGLVIFGYAGLLGYSNFYRMEVQTAVISAPIETVSAQADGQVLLTGLKPGDVVRSGEVVVNVVDNALERDIELADIAVKEQKAQLVFLKQKQTEELERLKGYAALEMKNVRQSKVELQGLEGQLSLAEAQFERMQSLFDKGFATESKLDEIKKQIIDLQEPGRKQADRTRLARRNRRPEFRQTPLHRPHPRGAGRRGRSSGSSCRAQDLARAGASRSLRAPASAHRGHRAVRWDYSFVAAHR